MTAPRPTVTLKLATSLDGRIATASGESKWITGEVAREEVHRLRAAHDAVLVGSQTVIDDDPELTVRLPGYDGPQPLRVVADARLRTPPSSKLVLSGAGIDEDDRPSIDFRRPVCVVTDARNGPLGGERLRSEADAARLFERSPSSPLVEAGAMVSYAAAAKDGGLEPRDILRAIAETIPYAFQEPRETFLISVLLEGGGKLAASFLRAGLIDRIEWFRAPILLGGDAKPALAALELGRLADAPRFKRLDVRQLGDDLWERYERMP